MKRFIIASIIFIVFALVGIIIDATFLDIAWGEGAMPNLIYYSIGWLAAGSYIATRDKGNK